MQKNLSHAEEFSPAEDSFSDNRIIFRQKNDSPAGPRSGGFLWDKDLSSPGERWIFHWKKDLSLAEASPSNIRIVLRQKKRSLAGEFFSGRR